MFGRNSTKLYAVYINPNDDVPHETAEFVDEHFTIWGFVFHGFWCVYQGMWGVGLAVLAAWAAFIGAADYFGINLMVSAVFELAIRLTVGFDGNHWRSLALRRKGFILSDIVSGESDLAAKRRFYDNWLTAQR